MSEGDRMKPKSMVFWTMKSFKLSKMEWDESYPTLLFKTKKRLQFTQGCDNDYCVQVKVTMEEI